MNSGNYLIRLREFIEIKNPRAAQSIVNSIKEVINQLKDFPYMGIKVDRAPNPDIIRELIIGNYTARYLIRPKEITILRIWHHKEEENRSKGVAIRSGPRPRPVSQKLCFCLPMNTALTMKNLNKSG